MTTLDELLRTIEDAIDEHLSQPFGLDGDQAPAVLRAVLDAGWRPTDRELAVCTTCRGAATIDTGETYRPWCRDCAGTGYVDQAAAVAP